MSNLLNTPPTDVSWHTTLAGTTWDVWYGVTWGKWHLLPVGSEYGVVSSPSLYSHSFPWRYTRFEVVMSVLRRGEEPGRAYQEVDKRELTAAEVEYIESVISQYRPQKVAIVGSRDYPDLEAVRQYVYTLPTNTTVVSGGAHGVDSAAEQAARERGLGVLIFPAEWDKYGKQAGFRRNADIVNAADKVVAFWSQGSKGTAHTIRIAREAGKPVEIVRAA
jgi:hypothetical protein